MLKSPCHLDSYGIAEIGVMGVAPATQRGRVMVVVMYTAL